jgi:microcystin degradation protein MlrC
LPFMLGIGENEYKVTIVSNRPIDGRFSESSPRHGGFVNFDMGPSAVVTTSTGQTIMLTSLRTLPFSLEQLLSKGLHPEDFDYIVAKGVNAPIAAYQPVCKTLCKVDTPGSTSADMTRFTFHNRRIPLFPFEI